MTFFWTGHNPAKHSNVTKSGDMKSYEARCGLDRLPTKKPLQLPTVTGSSKGAPQSSEVQDLASLTNSTCQAAAASALASPASRSGADVMPEG